MLLPTALSLEHWDGYESDKCPILAQPKTEGNPSTKLARAKGSERMERGRKPRSAAKDTDGTTRRGGG
jgi:hypothetical protein